jgi:hypothetical protein
MFPIRSLTLIVALTLATSVPLTAVANAAPAPQAQPQAAQQATGWEAEGYDGTDASLAQYAYDHGQLIEGYGVDVSKVYDTSKPYGWKANPGTGEAAYVGYCGDASLAEGEGEPDADRATGKRCAAELILLRERSGQPIEEDWMWKGAPAAVLEFNDALIDDWHATGAHEAYHAWPAPMGPQVRQFLSRVALGDSAF